MFNFIPQRIDSLSLYPIVFFQNKQDLSFQKHLPVYQKKLKLEDTPYHKPHQIITSNWRLFRKPFLPNTTNYFSSSLNVKSLE